MIEKEERAQKVHYKQIDKLELKIESKGIIKPKQIYCKQKTSATEKR